MATVLFLVKATIRSDQEDAFNRWYNEEHCPQMLRLPGVLSARRYRALMGEDRYRYVAAYEFRDQAAFDRFLASDEFRALRAEYDRRFGTVSERARFAYLEVWRGDGGVAEA